jgi:hypothetical protein
MEGRNQGRQGRDMPYTEKPCKNYMQNLCDVFICRSANAVVEGRPGAAARICHTF